MKPVRRVVTGQDEKGRSSVLFDSEISGISTQREHADASLAVEIAELWSTSESPVDCSGQTDRARREFELLPDPSGGLLRVVEFPPASPDAPARAGFHKTDTIDYMIVLRGEIYALLDEEEVLLRAGDVLIQRGTNHAWSNRGSEPCLVAAVMLDARPV